MTQQELKASNTQIGDHYKGFKSSPYKFFLDNQIPHHKASIIRRILRYDKDTGGGLEDLNKIKHEVDLIIEFEHWHKDNPHYIPTEEDITLANISEAIRKDA